MRRCYFVGGPFDGAWVDVNADDWLPPTWHLRPDPLERAQFGLVASVLPAEGSERYILSFVDTLVATYQHEDLHTGVPVRELEEVA